MGAGAWSPLPGGGRLWRLAVTSPGAESQSLLFRRAAGTMVSMVSHRAILPPSVLSCCPPCCPAAGRWRCLRARTC